MQLRHIGSLVLAATFTLTMSSAVAIAQDGAKQDMKAAGHETKDAAIDTGHGVKTGTTKAYHKTKHVSKKAYHKTAHGTETAAHDTADVSKKTYHGTVKGTEKLGDKVAGKPTPQ